MKTEQGIVIEVVNEIAKVKVGRHNDCKNCGACPGDNSVIITADNKIGAKMGERVAFEVKEDKVLKSAFIVFILPLVSLFIGVFLGGVIGEYSKSNIHMFQIVGGIITFILSMVFVKLFDKSVTKNNKSLPKITSILGK